jgi:hypothetical protein
LYRDSEHECDASILVPHPSQGDKILEAYIKTDDGVAQLSSTGEVLARARTLAEMFGC